MINWIRAKVSFDRNEKKSTGHLFLCGVSSISFLRFGEGDFPPFDCLSLTLSEAIKLRDWLDETIVSYPSEG